MKSYLASLNKERNKAKLNVFSNFYMENVKKEKISKEYFVMNISSDQENSALMTPHGIRSFISKCAQNEAIKRRKPLPNYITNQTRT